MKSDAARNGGASNTGTGYLPFTIHQQTVKGEAFCHQKNRGIRQESDAEER